MHQQMQPHNKVETMYCNSTFFHQKFYGVRVGLILGELNQPIQIWIMCTHLGKCHFGRGQKWMMLPYRTYSLRDSNFAIFANLGTIRKS